MNIPPFGRWLSIRDSAHYPAAFQRTEDCSLGAAEKRERKKREEALLGRDEPRGWGEADAF